MADAAGETRPMHWLLRIVWRLVLTGHAAVALCWLWMMPGGFPVGHPRFWANRGIPVLVLSGCVVGLFGVWRRRDTWVRLAVLAVPVGWATAAMAGRVIFPVSARWLFLAPLAAGPLKRDEALAITVHDGDRPACRVTFEDWAAQVSTALSPTAGWGLPQNAIEFSLRNLGSVNEVAIYVTLASTSVGRGWDSVGHAAGTYRNRMRIEPISPPDGGGNARSQMPDAR